MKNKKKYIITFLLAAMFLFINVFGVDYMALIKSGRVQRTAAYAYSTSVSSKSPIIVARGSGFKSGSFKSTSPSSGGFKSGSFKGSTSGEKGFSSGGFFGGSKRNYSGSGNTYIPPIHLPRMGHMFWGSSWHYGSGLGNLIAGYVFFRVFIRVIIIIIIIMVIIRIFRRRY